MRKIYVILVLLAVVAFDAWGQKKQFCNLSAEDVRIDSVLPRLSYSCPLPDNHTDSVYSVLLKYPEFIDMTAEDVAAYKALTDELPPAMPKVVTAKAYERKKARMIASLCPVVYRDGKYQFLVSYMVEFVAKPADSAIAKAKRKADEAPASRYAANSVLAKGRWAKVRVPATGIYQLTDAVIRRAGFTNQAKVKIYGYGGNLVPESLSDEYLREYDDLKEVPSCVVGGKRLFYAEGPVSWSSKTVASHTRNPYSDYGYYFITESEDTPLEQSEEEFLAAVYPSNHDYHSLYEKDEYAWFEGGRRLFEKQGIETGGSRKYNISVPSENTSFRLTVSASGNSNSTVDSKSSGTLQVLFNDSLVGKQSIRITEYDAANAAVNTWTISNKVAADNVVTVKNVDVSMARLDYITATFTKPRPAPNLAADAFPAAEYVYNITNQNHHADPQCDMVIIIPTSQATLEQAKRLKEHHEKYDGLSVNIVPADELYNEFSSGTPDVSAYRRYMKMLYDRAKDEKEMPKYLLLFGDALWDNRLNTSAASSLNADNLLLCFESENSFSETSCYTSDDFLGMLDDEETIVSNSQYTGIPDVGVGRMPAVTPAEAKVLVDKTIYYATNSCDGDWQNTIMFLGDDGNKNIHMNDVNLVADTIRSRYPGYMVKKVMWDAYARVSSSTGNRYPDITSLLKKQQNDGALIFDYAGHGAATSISHEQVLTLNDFSEFYGKNYSLWVTASCDIMPFDGSANCIGEVALLNSRGGAVAFYGTTRTVMSNYNKNINRLFMDNVLGYNPDGSMRTLGDANRITKSQLVDKSVYDLVIKADGSSTKSYITDLTVNKMQYTLLGDPALRLARPKFTVVIDSINGIATDSGEGIQMKAGSIVSLKGHVSDGKAKVEAFNGLASVTVRDAEQKIVCKLNNTSPEGATEPFVYYDRPSILYQGSDSVSKGEFSFVFAIPKDIYYSNSSGLINVYAADKERNLSAHGAFDKFNVGGSETAVNDSIGPSIYCYLNDPSFVNGGVVNSTPYFVAEISDEDGINASGSGVGHDLQLVIDGQPSLTYSLNDNFQYDFGSYTKGQTFMLLPSLPAGPHSLRFRAWDIQNNSSTTSLNFVVQAKMSPTLSNVYATPNPASDSVTFVVTHDRPGSEVQVTIDVMDASGRMLWSSDDSSSSNDNYYTMTWDMRLSSGARLQTGVYLYRVRLSCDGSEHVSVAKKLVVIKK